MEKVDFRITWLLATYLLTVALIIIGGITRLTDSGLSMVEWSIVGNFFPIGEAQWQKAFELYQDFPEFKEINTHMTLIEFKFIYLMEYAHRMLGRLVGLVVLLPFIYLWIRGKLVTGEFKKYFFLFILVCIQGFVGWYMVKSGLVDVPTVSQYRLVLHLFLALVFLSYVLWFLLEQTSFKQETNLLTNKWLIGLASLLAIQILLGGLVAGLNAAHISYTFPKIWGEWVPPNMFFKRPWLINFFENPITVHFFHRIMALIVVSYGLIFVFKMKYPNAFSKNWSILFCLLMGVQVTLGILTVILRVPTWTASLHQLAGVLLWSMTMVILFYHWGNNQFISS